MSSATKSSRGTSPAQLALFETCSPPTTATSQPSPPSARASRANRTPSRGNGGGEATNAGSGPKLPASFAKFDPATSSWRTSPGFSLPTMDTLTETFSGRWPRAGTMRNGAVFERPTWERRTDESDGSSSGGWPTPTVQDHKHGTISPAEVSRHSPTLATVVMLSQGSARPTPGAGDHRDRGAINNPCIQRRVEEGKQVDLSMMMSGSLNPAWVEALQGFPEGWTEPPTEQATEKKRRRSTQSK